MTKNILFISLLTIIVISAVLSYFTRQAILNWGISHRQVYTVKYALFWNADAKKPTSLGMKPLFLNLNLQEDSLSAVILKEIIAQDSSACDCYQNDSLKIEPIMYAGKIQKLKYLEVLSSTCNINSRDHLGFKPIVHFVDDMLVFKKFLDLNATVDNVDGNGNSIFHLYSQYNALSYANKKFPTVINSYNNFGQTPLTLAIRNTNLRHLANLTQIGADPHILDNDGYLPLSKAVQTGETSFASFLLRNGAQINKKNLDGTTAIFFAETPKMYKYLRRHGADPYVTDNEENNILHTIDNQEVFSLIVDGLDLLRLDKPNVEGITPLMRAAAEGNDRKFFKIFNKRSICDENLYYLARKGGNQRILGAIEKRGVVRAERRIAGNMLLKSAIRKKGTKMFLRRIATKFIPVLGWVSLAFDILQLASD